MKKSKLKRLRQLLNEFSLYFSRDNEEIEKVLKEVRDMEKNEKSKRI